MIDARISFQYTYMFAINPRNIVVITNKPTHYVIDNNAQYNFQHLLRNRLVRNSSTKNEKACLLHE